MTLNAAESELVARLGVYGCWLLKHGKGLPHASPAVQRVMHHYTVWRSSNPAKAPAEGNAIILMHAVDQAIKEESLEPIIQNYDAALKDLIQCRQEW